MKKIYFGNIPWFTTEEDLEDFFSNYGAVNSFAIFTDRETGRSRGFGFVEMDDDAADAAVANGDGQMLGGRALRINEAHDRPRGGGGGGGGGRGPRR
ncbi:MAG: RNA-binding protein [Anaerolineales bacterium]|nr:RNA-binding protein [Anaerolineales bacterium]